MTLKGLHWDLVESYLKKITFENLYVLVTNAFSVLKLIVWYLNMSSIDLAARL